ncbi:MAG: cysteine-rich small domain-containing protein [Epsilonproteobacteria bacterium]|nr:cysteine-rich small domain-containing protein [Campylobacterota bacterium]
MSYYSWFQNHANKHQNIVQKVKKEELISYFRWENISQSDIDFCPLFSEGKKCHEMEDLNCYLCACPNFRFNDNATTLKSWCAIDSKEGRQLEHEGIIHQDCSQCTVPHHESYIKKKFDTNWLEIMKACPSKDRKDKES